MAVFRGDELAFHQLPGRWSADPLAAMQTQGISARIVRLEPAPRSPHRHPYSPELIYVARGEGRTWIDDSATPVGAGDIVYVPAGAPHATICDPASTMLLVCFFPHPDLTANTEELPGDVGG